MGVLGVMRPHTRSAIETLFMASTIPTKTSATPYGYASGTPGTCVLMTNKCSDMAIVWS